MSVDQSFIIEKLPTTISESSDAEMDSFINMLWDQDMDMGVDRYMYDPILREQQFKKQEAEQKKLQDLKKKFAQQETLNFIIDEETGERIPNPSAAPLQPPTAFTDDTDLSKELLELADLQFLLGEDQSLNINSQAKQAPPQNAIPLVQPQQVNYSNSNMIVQTADQPHIPSDIDLWPTEITMLPGPAQDDSPQDNSYNTDNMYMTQMWPVDTMAADRSSRPGFYGNPSNTLDAAPQYQGYNDSDSADRYHTSTSPYFSAANSDSGVSVQDSFLDSVTYNEDVKPHFLYSSEPSGQHTGHMVSGSSSNYSSSENGDGSSSSTSQGEKEKRSICRDELRCKELNIPFSVEMITNYPVEEFNTLLRQHRLSEEQLTLVKDIRRRGKNKVAAQNCRKKKMNELTGLELEINDLKRKRSELVRDKDDLKRSKLHLRKQLDQTYVEVFNSIRDHLGRPYDPRFYTLHISDEGDAHVIPNKMNSFPTLDYHLAA